MEWFSCMAEFANVVGAGELRFVWRSVFVFRAESFDDAFPKAVEVARAEEREHVNVNGEKVVWRLIRIVTIDMLGAEIADGREVWFEPVEAPVDATWTVDTTFTPETSTWGHSGV